MPLKMRKQERKQFVERAKREYAHAGSRKEKSALIDAVVQFVGYKSRKQAIRVLNRQGKSKMSRKKGRRKKLSIQETDVLREVWFAMGQPCGKRMQPALGEWLGRLEKRPGVDIEKLLGISAATLDRELAQFKVRKAEEKEEMLHLTSLKKSIPYVDRRAKLTEPGQLSADTVAHCNGDMSGDFVWTLTVTDELTGWTQNRAIWNKGQFVTCAALVYILREMPFRARSINTDNGSEFINHHLQRFLKEHYKTCTITRSRPNKKNDNARVEERNLHVVRECIGYERLGDERFVRALNRIYKANNLLINHFQTWSRVESKERRGTRVIRRMDKPQTPYQRVMKHLKEGTRKQRLRATHEALNPWVLRAEIQAGMTAMRRLFEEIQLGCSGGRRCNRKGTC